MNNRADEITVLVIDDEEPIRELFKINLEKLNYKCLLASNSKEAIEIHKKYLKEANNIHITILDLNIPGDIGGKEVAVKIRELNPDAKIIVASGDSYGDKMTNYSKHGFDAALEKNFNRENIKNTIEKILHKD